MTCEDPGAKSKSPKHSGAIPGGGAGKCVNSGGQVRFDPVFRYGVVRAAVRSTSTCSPIGLVRKRPRFAATNAGTRKIGASMSTVFRKALDVLPFTPHPVNTK